MTGNCSGLNTLAAHTVSEVIDLTQKLAHFAAYDEVRGANPDFADIRSMGSDVLAFSRLTLEPFEAGSYRSRHPRRRIAFIDQRTEATTQR